MMRVVFHRHKAVDKMWITLLLTLLIVITLY